MYAILKTGVIERNDITKCHNTADIGNQSDYIIKNQDSEINGMQEESIVGMRVRQKNPPHGITVYPKDRFSI